MKKIYLTTPLYYLNDKPHIGHAYTTIATDIIARWNKIQGFDVFFLTGTDEHGTKIAKAAKKNDQSVVQYVQDMCIAFKNLWKVLDIDYDDFIRTTEDRHIHVVQQVFQTLYDKKLIYKDYYEGWYCVTCETFLLQKELIKNTCPVCFGKIEILQEESYFFDLPSFQDRLLQLYESNPDFIYPRTRRSEIINFVQQGLKHLSITRKKEKWGITVPFDDTNVIYVWFDALLNYVTAPGYLSDEDKFHAIWPCDIHFIGKEITRFHAVIWPAILMALDLELPKKIFSHGWWTVDGQKMSKSLGNIVDPIKVVAEYNADALRFFLFREVRFGFDGNFSMSSFKMRYESELADAIGNLFSRSISLIEKYFGDGLQYNPSYENQPMLVESSKLIAKYYDAIDIFNVLKCIMEVVATANRYFENIMPWKLVKDDLPKAEIVFSESIAILRWIAFYLYPFMPTTSNMMWQQLGLDKSPLILSKNIILFPYEFQDTRIRVKKTGIFFPKTK